MMYSRKHKFLMQKYKQFQQSLIIPATKKQEMGVVFGPKLELKDPKKWGK